MTPDEANAALALRSTRVGGRPPSLTPAEAKRRALARSNAHNRARGALTRLHPDEYVALYAAALAEEMAK